MAMSHALLLLVSLFFLPVLLGAPFEYCKNIRDVHDYFDVDSVGVEQYIGDMVNIRVTGLTKKNIPWTGSNIFVYVTVRTGVQEIEYEVTRYRLCDVGPFPCNSEIEAGGFFLILRNVLELFKDDLYSVYVRTEKGAEWPPTIFMCVEFYLERDTLAHTLASA